MKRVSLFLICLLVSIPAYAGVGGNLSKEEKEMGYKFLFLAEKFGINEYVFANKNADSVLFEYVPSNQKVETWTDMATVTLYSPNATTEQSEKELDKIIELQKKMLGKNIVKSEIYSSGPTKLSFVEYTIGEGSTKEHNLAITYLFTGQMVGMFQVQKRGGSPSEETTGKFLKIIKDVTTRVVENK